MKGSDEKEKAKRGQGLTESPALSPALIRMISPGYSEYDRCIATLDPRKALRGLLGSTETPDGPKSGSSDAVVSFH